MWDGIDVQTAKKRVNYYVQTNQLYSIRRGLYAKDKEYDRLEMATKIITPAYISFETVLGQAGVTFQYYSQIFVASYQTREIEADHQKIVFRTLKDTLLTNSAGIDNKENYAIASIERAFLDVVYLNKDYHFDNLSPVDWEKAFAILPAYGNLSVMQKRVNRYYQSVNNSQV